MTAADSSPPLDTVDHIAIQVSNIQETLDWYNKHFKIVIEYQDQSWAYIKFANIHLALVVAGQHPQHLGFCVEDASKYGELTAHRDGTKSVYVHDPAGNPVEFIDKSSCK